MSYPVWFKEKSRVNTDTVRTINKIVAFILFMITVSMLATEVESIFPIPLPLVILSVLVGCIWFCINLEIVLKHTTFYEWDYTERMKKARFTTFYCGLNSFFTIMFCISLCVLILNSIKYGFVDGWFSFFLFLSIPCFWFLFNLMNTISLWHSFFKEDLEMAYKIQKKPDNWIESGREIKPEDEISEIMRRDLGVDL